MNSKLFAAASFLVTAAGLPKPATAGQPPGLTPDLPGVTKSKAEAYWIAPYVRVSEEGISKHGTTTVTWFIEEGKIKRKTEVNSFQPGFVTAISRRHRNVVQGVNEDWRIALPAKSGPSGYITSTPDSGVFVHEFHPKQGQIALDIYVHGKLANTVGPFRQYLAESVHLSDDGSAALIVWNDESEKTAQVAVIDPGGKLSFRVDCDHPVHSPLAAPEGTGALPRPNTGGTNQNTFHLYTREGKLRSLDIGPNPHCVGWIPETRKSLFSTSLGFESRYRLIDWDAAKTLWDIPCPGNNGHTLAIGLTPRLVIFALGELYQGGPWRGSQWVLREHEKEWIRAFYAVNLHDGSLVARWQAPYPRRLSTDDRDSFLRLGDKLFFITAHEVVELSDKEIISKTNGWK